MNLAPESSSQLHSDLTVSLKSYRRSMSSSDLCWTSRDSPESAHLNRTQLLPAESSGQDKCRVHPKVTSSQHHLTEPDQTGLNWIRLEQSFTADSGSPQSSGAWLSTDTSHQSRSDTCSWN